MKSKVIIFSLLACSLLYGCNGAETTNAKLSPEGVEQIEVEDIIVEEIKVETIEDNFKPITIQTYDNSTTYWD